VRRLGVVAGLVATLACADGLGPTGRLSLVITPVFSQQALAFLTDDLNALHVRATRVPSPPGTVVFDDTVPVDTTGSADLFVKVPLANAEERFEVLLEGLRASDGVVLYMGRDTVTVSALASASAAVVPVAYVGPCGASAGCSITVAPQDSVASEGTSVLVRVAVDSAGKQITGVPVAFTNLTPALIVVTPDRRITALVGTPGGLARVLVATNGAVDTLRLNVAPEVIVTPAYATLTTVAPANAVQLSTSVSGASWASLSPAVATVSSNGLVTAVARGTAVIVASAGSGLDSAVVAVGDPTGSGDVIALALSGNRSFATSQVGKPVAIDVVVDLKAAPTDLLGAYAAQFTWNPGVLKFDSTSAGTAFLTPQPIVGTDTTGLGVLQVSDVSASGAGGVQTLVRLWFTATAAGTSSQALGITQMVSALTGSDYAKTNRVVVASGSVTVVP